MGKSAAGRSRKALAPSLFSLLFLTNCMVTTNPVGSDIAPSVLVVATSPTAAETAPALIVDPSAVSGAAEADVLSDLSHPVAPTQPLGPAPDPKAASVVAAAPAAPEAITIPTRSDMRALRKRRFLSETDVVHILRYHGFPERDIPALVCTVKNESSFITHADNINKSDGSHDTGLFQINDMWLHACKMTRRDLRDPIKNAKCARLVYQERGLRAWLGFTRKHECRTYQLADAD